jgi:GT2 family glycosyltransferase
MATAVLDLDINQIPAEIDGLDRYQQALILIRVGQLPVGQVRLAVVDGGISGNEIYQMAISTCSYTLAQQRLYEYLSWEEVPSTWAPPTATVAVCTRNRPDDLRHCLNALIQLPDDGHELLVVDSCSSDGSTRQVVEAFPRVRYVREERPGLNIARNRALQEASHEIIAFCDDDAMPDPGWLRGLLRNFHDPLVLCTTGLTMPFELETEAQELFERYSPFNRGFRRRIYDRYNCNPLAAGRVGAGANMALRRTVLAHVGQFDESLDAGTPTQSGGDTEMFSRIMAAGYRIVYDPVALSWHRHRRTMQELLDTVYGYGVGTYAYWTRRLLFEREVGVFLVAFYWIWQGQAPALFRSLLRHPGSFPLSLLLAELHGCVAGPWAYLRARG